MEREPHFLDEYVKELQESGDYVSDEIVGSIWFNPAGDCAMFLSVNEGVIAERIDEYLTIYQSANDDRTIGFQIKGVLGLLAEFGYDAAQIDAVIDENDEVSKVTLNMLLLKSYESRPITVSRRKAYAEAMTSLPTLANV